MTNQLFIALGLCLAVAVHAEERTIDISGNNTSSDYRTYSSSISLPATDTVNVKMARYCYFSSTISGKGLLNLYGGGERCYLGNSDKKWPNWTHYTGDIHILPFKENSPGAGWYGVVLAHGGKSSSPETALDDAKSGKVNPSMANNRVTLLEGATMACEANTAGAGFRIGELNTEAGSTLSGYYKKSRAAYYLVGGLNTDATLAGTIAPTDYRDDTPLSIVKEGSGTYTITGNNNCLSGALRILEGRVNVMNDCAEAESKKLRGALGAMSDATKAVAYVFSQGVLGGTGSIGGTVDNYGTIEPGIDGIGQLILRNFVEEKNANLILHPGSVIRVKAGAVGQNTGLRVDGEVLYSSTTEDFMTSDKMPVIDVVVADDAQLQIGDVISVMFVDSKNEYDKMWNFDVRANKYTWEVEELTPTGFFGGTEFLVRLTSFEDMNHSDDSDDPDHPESTMGAFYDDGIDDAADKKTLSYYAQKNYKSVGVALATYKGLSSDREEAARQFNMMVCENEMKFDALEPSRNSFSFGGADNLVSLAQQHDMAVRGHCLVWHSQLPTWVSSDGKKNDKGWTREEALDIMKNHITKVMTHFKGKVREWDVVNECLDDDQTTVRTHPDGYDLRRQSVWQLTIGDDYVDSAFVYAHRADPDAELYLNDYGVELQGKAKTQAFYNLAVRLKENGIPIHGVGLQCHFSIDEVDSVKLDNTIKRFSEAGLKCIITELDMGIPSTSAENLEEQARCYRVITDIVLNHDNCPSMVIWGIKDNDSWRTGSNPLLYTSALECKPAWYAVRSALRHRDIVNGSSGVKVIDNGRWIMDNAVYDFSGRPVGNGQLKSGLYISKGRKWIVR
jgi:autotransporter-associated beta strand protein